MTLTLETSHSNYTAHFILLASSRHTTYPSPCHHLRRCCSSHLLLLLLSLAVPRFFTIAVAIAIASALPFTQTCSISSSLSTASDINTFPDRRDLNKVFQSKFHMQASQERIQRSTHPIPNDANNAREKRNPMRLLDTCQEETAFEAPSPKQKYSPASLVDMELKKFPVGEPIRVLDGLVLQRLHTCQQQRRSTTRNAERREGEWHSENEV